MSDQDKMIDLGTRAEALLKDETFQAVLQVLESEIVQQVFATEPHEAKRREYLYTKHQALKDLYGTLTNWVGMKEQVLREQAERY